MASVVIYARVSTEEGQDTAAQVRVCREYAERHGYTVHQVYEDHASAVNFRGRKAWRTMMADMKRWHPRTRPKAILAYALDRVIRSMLDYVNITEQLKTLDVALVTADGTLGEIGDPGDPYREFMAGFWRSSRSSSAKSSSAGPATASRTRRPRASSSGAHVGRLIGRLGGVAGGPVNTPTRQGPGCPSCNASGC